MAKMTVAGLLVDALAARGVERMYGVSGDSLNGISDSIRRIDPTGAHDNDD
jgi:pyruvate dehydrogenase (quinone)